jgi:pimeloyl-ACP methyl ester carboxylesterase
VSHGLRHTKSGPGSTSRVGGSISVDGVVLVHGSNLSGACWGRMRKHLATSAVAVDLPGRGSRPADISAVTLDDCVEAVVDSANEAGFDQFVLVGHSLGGVVITEAASRDPERVVSLVYVGALIPAAGQSAAGVVFGADLPTTHPQMATEERAKLFFANDMSDEQWGEVWRQFVPESPLLWNAGLSGHRAEVPITYVSMSDDVGVPRLLADEMINNLGNGVDHRVLSAGHLAMVSKPQALAAIIDDTSIVDLRGSR